MAYHGGKVPEFSPARDLNTATNPTRRRACVIVFVLFGLFFAGIHLVEPLSHQDHLRMTRVSPEHCTQTEPSFPNNQIWDTIGKTISTDVYKRRAVESLAGAVRIPTESFDMMLPVGQDSRWDAFIPFHAYLKTAFPLTHLHLSLTKVNTYGLLYTWKGSDPTLKPTLLMGHQDVVPVDPITVEKWQYPPYSGHFDGSKIHGRGSSDDKAGVIGILSTIELFLEHSFRPRRTIVLSFGFDEEISGSYGAKNLAQVLLNTYGKDSFALIVDEGGGFSDKHGAVIAQPSVAEKGYLDVRIEVTAPGGHSSVPPIHTSIGMLASLLVRYEENPYAITLTRKSPVYTLLQCLGVHAPALPDELRKAIRRSQGSDKGLRELEGIVVKDKLYKSLLGTTQAIDVIEGGVKSNALPEQAWAVVNHRISTESSVGQVQKQDTGLLAPLASQFNLTFFAFGDTIIDSNGTSGGSLTLRDAFGDALEPAPVTPTDSAAYRLLSASIKATYHASVVRPKQNQSSLVKEAIFVVPGLSTGNTDTKFYWSLSSNIFRYNHKDGKVPSNAHTVNESMELGAFLEVIRFFSTLILNADESTEL